MFDARHQNGYANVAWLIARWMKRKGAGTQKESQICCGQFISKIARKCKVLTEDVVRSLNAPVYCRDLDTITLIDLIDSEGSLQPTWLCSAVVWPVLSAVPTSATTVSTAVSAIATG
ncbi:hypothetical protein Tco_1290093 [Tanacetum coccineum]